MTNGEWPENVLEYLRLGDNRAFEQLYRQHYRVAADFVRKNSGNEQDARDVFQEALLVLVKKARDQQFRLTTEPGTFLLAVVRNLWLYRLRSRHKHPQTDTISPELLPDAGAAEIEDLLHEQGIDERLRAVQQMLETLNPECRQLLHYAYWQRLPAAEIASLLGYTEAFVKVKKHRCMAALREKVKNHPAFNDGA